MSSTNIGTTGTSTSTGGGQAKQVASGIKGVFAKIHGAGEEIRGEFNGAVDELSHDKHGAAKNEAVAAGGRNEMETGQFTRGTKVKEGVEPSVGVGGTTTTTGSGVGGRV